MSKQLKLSKNFMTGMIVFTNPEAYLRNVNCNCCFTVETLYDAIVSYKQPIWNEKQTIKIIQMVEKLNSSSYLLNKEHENYVKDIKHRKEVNKLIAANKRGNY